MELEKVVQDTINNMVSSGKVTEMVEKHLANTVDEIVKDSLRTYGDFGKQVKEAVQSVINIDLSNMKLLDLSGTITQVVKDQLQQSVNENILANVKEAIDDVSGSLDKKEFNLSEIIDKFKAQAESYDKDDAYEITLHVINESYGYKHIYFDYKEGVEKYRCAFQLDLNKDNKVYSFQGGKLKMSSDSRFVPIHGSFEKFLFRLYAAGAKVILDDVNTYYEEEY